MRWREYPRYKDSGVEWLGDIPEHWEVKRIKNIGKVKYGLGEPPDQLEDGLPFIRATDIYRGKINSESILKVDPHDIPWSRDPVLRTNDILVVRSGAYTGDSAIVPEEWAGAIAGYDMILRVAAGAVPQFIAYALLSKYLLNGQIYLERSRAAQPHLNAEELRSFIILSPTISEQEEIGTCLNSETTRIDALMEKKQRQIELLQEKRAALISHAVTKGLDPTAPMKDSGIEWFDHIPAHWELKRLKFLASEPLKYGANESAEIDDPDLPRYIRITDITEGGSLRDNTFKSLPEDVAEPFLLEHGDILLARSGATAGKTFMYQDSWGRACYAGYLIRVRTKPIEAIPQFLSYFTNSSVYWGWLSSVFIQATIQNVSAEKYANMIMSSPPIDEQKEIVAFLDHESAKINTLIGKVQESIDSLKEYRTALISAAVTGQIDVREEAA